MTTQIAPRFRQSVLVDSSGFFALMNSADTHHPEAQRIMDRAVSEHWWLVTTNFVIAETHALTLIRYSQQAATRFLQEMETTSITIVRAQAQDEAAGRNIIYRYQDKRFSLTDAISFAVMERLGIKQAFTFDRNFSQYGFTTIDR